MTPDDVNELIPFLTGLAKHRCNVAIAKQENARIVYRNGLRPKHAASMRVLYQQHAHRMYGEAQCAREEWFMLERAIATLKALQAGQLVLSCPGRVPYVGSLWRATRDTIYPGTVIVLHVDTAQGHVRVWARPYGPEHTLELSRFHTIYVPEPP